MTRRQESGSLKLPTGCEFFASQEVMPPEALLLLEQYAYEFGETYDSYLATEDDRQYFWLPGQRGVVGFVRWGRVLNALGGLLAPPEHQEELLQKLLEFVELNGLTINFFNVGRTEEKLFRQHEFKINKCTEELIVRLDRTNWQGKPYDWLRRQENYCIRQQLRVEEIDPSDNPDLYREWIVPELEEVNREHLDCTLHGRELVFFEGRWDPWALRRRRLFATWKDGRIVSFIVCNPALGGDLWAVEIYRRRKDAPRGVIPYTILQIMRQMKDEGVPYVSLSSVPFIRCGPPIKNDDLRFQGSCQFFWHAMNWLFDVKGIYHFKSRFRPDYREMFVATYPRMSILSMYSMGAVWGLFKVSPLRLMRHVLQFWKNRHGRKSMATPPPRPERKIRDLRRSTEPQEPAIPKAAPVEVANGAAHSNGSPARAYPVQSVASQAYPIRMEEH